MPPRERQRRENGGKPLCHHALSASGRSYHDEVVSAGGCHLQCPLHILLSADICKVEVEGILVLIKFLPGIDKARLWSRCPIEEVNDLQDVLHAVDFQCVYHGRLVFVGFRHDDALEFLCTCLDGDGQYSFDGLQGTVETELSHEHEVAQTVMTHLLVGSQNGYCQREIETGTFLLEVGGSKIGGDVGYGKFVTVIEKCGGDTVMALLYRPVGKAGKMEQYTPCDTYFDGHGGDFHSVDSCTECFYKHDSGF